MTGLSDEQRADFKLMKAVAGVTLGDPKNRVIQLNRFAQRVTTNENIKKELLEWDMVRIIVFFEKFLHFADFLFLNLRNLSISNSRSKMCK